MKKILILNGPNLNLLGTRESEIYGTDTLEELMMWVETNPISLDHSFMFYQSNHEGEIIDTIQDERLWANGLLINPAAFTHYSYAIRDTISSVDIPTVEVHLSDIHNRDEFRQISVISPVCIEQVIGFGKDSYIKGLDILLKYLAAL